MLTAEKNKNALSAVAEILNVALTVAERIGMGGMAKVIGIIPSGEILSKTVGGGNEDEDDEAVLEELISLQSALASAYRVAQRRGQKLTIRIE